MSHVVATLYSCFFVFRTNLDNENGKRGVIKKFANVLSILSEKIDDMMCMVSILKIYDIINQYWR